MNEIEKRLQDDAWNTEIAHRVRKVRTRRRNTVAATGATMMAVLALLVTVFLHYSLPSVNGTEIINRQIAGILTDAYTDYTVSDDTVDGQILSMLAER
ncbi:MAG: hypothetical protein ACOC2H_02905 [Spirochaetota bacterium]